MFVKNRNKASFLGVGLFLILMGAGIFSVGLVMWIDNFFGATAFSMPGIKVMGGLIVMALGYIALEIELIRTKRLQ